MAVCKTCGAKIKWIKTKAGRSMPVDPDPVWFRPVVDGPELYITSDGQVVSGVKDPDGINVGYVSHFATCPDADRHRRRNGINNR